MFVSPPEMDAACLGAGPRAREHACVTRGRARPGGAALRREIGCIMLAGFERIGPGVEMGGDASVNRLRSHFFFLEIF